MRLIPDYKVNQFFGLNTEIQDLKSIPKGFTPDQKNWITSSEKDSIALRRGTALLGLTDGGIGKITGLGIGTRYDGTQVPFFSYGRKVFYYNATTDDRVEVGTNLLPATANNDEVSIFPYQNLAGAFVYLSSINSSIYKIPVANPGNSVDQQSTTYRGFFKFGQSRSFLFNRNGATAGNKDETGLYCSWVDRVSLADYPAQVTGEAVGGSGSQSYSYTLVQITGKRTAMYVQVQATVAAGTETFTDNRNGVLTSNLGGTGTVNYATGAIAVTFSAVTTGAVTASYYYEDATSEGVCDFSFNTTTRVPGTGNYFPQFDGGGKLNSVFPLATTFYGFHELKTWQTAIPTDDGTEGLFVNLPFREKMGVNSNYAVFGGEKGIYFINTADPNKPEFYRLELYQGATTANIAQPKLLSELMDFSAFTFDYAVVFEWGDYILLSCQESNGGVVNDFNSKTFIYNKKSGVWDVTDYPATRFSDYGGTLIAGDPLLNNVYTLFSGFDDDDSLIPNYWTSGQTNLGVSGTKRFTRMVVDGLMQTSQNVKVSLSFDGADFVDVFTIQGTGTYVDTGASIAVGSYTIGSKEVGGGDTVTANPFQVEFSVQSPRFEYVRVRFEATGGGYIQINEYTLKDIREKGRRILPSRIG